MIDCDWSYNGIKICVLNNDTLHISILPEIGGIIWSVKYNGYELMYHHYKELELPWRFKEDFPREDSLHTLFIGGWFEVLPNVGYKTNLLGVSWGLHGETPYLPWKVEYDEEKDPNSILLIVQLKRYPIKLYRRISLNRNEILLREKVVNLAPIDLYFSWLHHPTFGGDLLDDSTIIELSNNTEIEVDKYLGLKYSQFEAGFRGEWPIAKGKDSKIYDLSRYPPKGSQNTNDLIYVPKMKRGWFKIINEKRKITFEAEYENSLFKSLWIWRPVGGGPEDPWYGTIYATSLEITTSWPATGLSEQVKLGTAEVIKANSKIETVLKFTIK